MGFLDKMTREQLTAAYHEEREKRKIYFRQVRDLTARVNSLETHLQSALGELAERAPKKSNWAKVTPKVRFSVLTRDGFRCTYCGRSAKETNLEIDHVVPRSGGGKTIMQNLRTACQDCNVGKGKTLMALEQMAAGPLSGPNPLKGRSESHHSQGPSALGTDAESGATP